MKKLLFFVICLMPSLALADNKNMAEPKDWDKSLAFGFNLTQGNSDTLLGTVKGELSKDHKVDLWRFAFSGSYGETETDEAGDDETTQEDFSADAEYKHLFSEKWYGGFGTTYLYDGIQDVDYRVTLKPSLGYFPIKNEKHKFNIDIGPGFVLEKVDGIKDEYLAPRISERYEWKISDTAKFYEQAEVLFDASDSDNTIVNAEVGLESALTSMFSLTLTIRDKYDNQPAEGLKRNDIAIVSAIKVNL